MAQPDVTPALPLRIVPADADGPAVMGKILPRLPAPRCHTDLFGTGPYSQEGP